MSPRLSRLIGALLICLLILAGVSTYQFLHDHQRTNLINDHRSNIPMIAETAITQALKQRGLIRLQGTVHSASSRPAQPASLPRARLARRKTSKTNTPPMAPARNSLKTEQQLTPDHEDNLVYDAYCKKKKNRRPSAKSNRKLSPRLEAQ